MAREAGAGAVGAALQTSHGGGDGPAAAAPLTGAPPAPPSLPAPLTAGSRRHPDGSVLVSSGVPGLDAALGGGLALGSVVLLEEDAAGGAACALGRLFAAAGAAAGHRVVAAGHDGRRGAADVLAALPLNVSRGSRDLEDLAAGAGNAGAAEAGAGAGSDYPHADAQDEGDAARPGEDAVAGLRNAWQYKKYLVGGGGGGVADAGARDAGAPAALPFAPTFDLSRRAPPSALARARPVVLPTVPPPPGVAGLPPVPGSDGAGDEPLRLVDAVLEALSAGDAAGGGGRGAAGAAAALRARALSAGVARAARAAREASPPAPALYAALTQALAEELAPPPSSGSVARADAPTRVLLLGLGGPGWPDWAWGADDGPCGAGGGGGGRGGGAGDGAGSPAPSRGSAAAAARGAPLLRFLACLSRAVEGASSSGGAGAVALVTLPSWALPQPLAAAARAHAHVVLKAHAFGEPARLLARAGEAAPAAGVAAGTTAPEFAGFTGLVLVRRAGRPGAPGATAAATNTPTLLYRLDRRRLVVEPPHLPPADAAAAPGGAGEPGGGARRAGASGASGASGAGAGQAAVVVGSEALDRGEGAGAVGLHARPRAGVEGRQGTGVGAGGGADARPPAAPLVAAPLPYEEDEPTELPGEGGSAGASGGCATSGGGGARAELF